MTTAGYKNTFAYEKLITLLVRMITEPEKAFILGGTYKIPVLMGLLSASFVADLQRDGTFNEAAFEREYGHLFMYSLNLVNCWEAEKVISSQSNGSTTNRKV